MPRRQPGPAILFGSGETSASGQKVFDWLLRHLPTPAQVAILETPAGFELNSAQVAGRIGEFLARRLQNYRPQVTVVPARKRGILFSPDSPEIAAVLARAAQPPVSPEAMPDPPAEVALLTREREEARARRDWAAADALRRQIAALGWRVVDTPDGPHLEEARGAAG